MYSSLCIFHNLKKVKKKKLSKVKKRILSMDKCDRVEREILT